ncbi:putative F-box protein At3g24580 [Apium graveolens]|uniref:putative F-box protein At3g24580 n=1 Tax=Apium graveolens TaxID=4045 RepID=UPI003D7B25F5
MLEKNGDVYLWNPSIRKLKVVPKFRKSGHLDEAIGFWFNAEKNDYEVVRIGYAEKMSSVEVYSLSSNSWKLINETCPGALDISDKNLVYVKGTLRWLAKQEQGWIIVSLDINNGKFRQKFISDPCPPGTYFYLTRIHEDYLPTLRCGWSRNAFGVQQSACSIEVYDKNLMMISRDSYVGRGMILVGFRNNGEALLIQIPGSNTLLSYNFESKQFKDFGLFCADPAFTCPFVKSLVLLNECDVQTTMAPVSENEFI